MIDIITDDIPILKSDFRICIPVAKIEMEYSMKKIEAKILCNSPYSFILVNATPINPIVDNVNNKIVDFLYFKSYSKIFDIEFNNNDIDIAIIDSIQNTFVS